MDKFLSGYTWLWAAVDFFFQPDFRKILLGQMNENVLWPQFKHAGFPKNVQDIQLYSQAF